LWRKPLRYIETVTLNEAALGSGAFNAYTPSSLYDPNNTGAGHQPMYFDQICSSSGPYTQYRTYFTRAKITFANFSTSAANIGWYVSPNGSTPASGLQALEKPFGDWTWLSGTNAGNAVKTFTVSIPHSRALGVTEEHLRNDDYYAGSYNSSPSKNFFLVVYAYGAAAVSNMYCTVELDIDSEFFSLTNTSIS